MPCRSLSLESSRSSDLSEEEVVDIELGRGTDDISKDIDDKSGQNPALDWTDPKALIVSYPNPQEVEFAKSRIKRHVFACDTLYTEYNILEARLAGLKEQIKTHERKVLHLKALIAPIRRLPLELLSVIIRIHVRDHLESVWRAMRVCRAWRAAALLTKDAWNAILLCNPESDLVRHARWTDGRFEIYEVCDTKKRLETVLARAGSVPLEIFVHSDLATPLTSIADGAPAENILHLFRHIEALVSTPRLRSLKLNAPQWNSILPVDFLATWDLSPLEELDTSVENLLKRTLNTCTRLTRLELPSHALRVATKTKYFSHIRELAVAGDAPPTFYQDLSSCGGIYKLNFAVDVPRDNVSTISMPEIRHLDLSFTAVLWPIACPNITHLQISQADHRFPERLPNRVHLPHLIEFEAKSSAFTTKYDFLDRFEAPKLRLLDLKDTESTRSMTSRTMGDLWPSQPKGLRLQHYLDPFVLKLRWVNINTKVLTRTISHLTRCVELHLIEVIKTPEFFELMCQLERQGNKVRKAFTLLPTLRVLVIEIMTSGRFIKKDFFDAAYAFLERRKALKTPLNRLAVMTPYSRSWEEL
ncbi:hypothetical protein PIIN_10508, partial [Serendipita indica DSM 11827]